MTTKTRHAADYVSKLLAERNIDDLAGRLRPDSSPSPPHVPGGSIISAEAVERRWQILDSPTARGELLDAALCRNGRRMSATSKTLSARRKYPLA